MLWTDRFGRRMIVFVSSVICTICMLVVAVIGLFPSTTPLKNFCIFVGCLWSLFNAALGSLGWAFVGEIATQKLRARTAGIAAGLSVLIGLTFNTSVPIMCKLHVAQPYGSDHVTKDQLSLTSQHSGHPRCKPGLQHWVDLLWSGRRLHRDRVVLCA